jgi:hypothetical protein
MPGSNASYTFRGSFTREISTGLPSVLIGGMTASVPEPNSAVLLVSLSAVLLIKRRR